ncbi:hypothetical protein CC53_gp166 [Rhizobium phage vB_RleS_L338C]|uniref:hypothetical protein n=1 Tax=Rhizobium phage vB_RleS_L338C TaxID=1414737 RepID=UPI0003D9178A|nr:hypothetical protein CC53_gp166 [Rhizobium phage vB_RleS_L338C]AHC30583.1 hypothetical protein L338C_166 [Rhizobium phage vB_RleS_L338C]QNH72138.1 hypothetical protein P11VFA_152 [Rhizobium phage P11VFA]
MALFHIALVKASSFSSVGTMPIYDLVEVDSEILDTSVSMLSELVPNEKGLYWSITALDADNGGWVTHGTEPGVAAIPAPSKGFPIYPRIEKAYGANKGYRLGIYPMPLA